MNPVLSTNAVTTEGILFWSYGISNNSPISRIDHYSETQGRIGNRMEDLRVEAAMIQAEVNRTLEQPHHRAIIEAKYGERPAAAKVCAEMLSKTVRTQTVEALVRIVEDFCGFRRYRDREAIRDLRMGRNAARETRFRYYGILEGWHWMAYELVDEAFRQKGWVE